MRKTIQIPYIDRGVSRVCTLDVCDLARRAADPTADLGDAPSAWRLAGLIAHNDAGEYTLTPRGEDWLASIDALPEDHVPEAAKVSTCTKCEGKDERPLFTSTYPCEDCNGTGERVNLRAHAKSVTFAWSVTCEPGRTASWRSSIGRVVIS